jgi:hypothetical protein
LLLCEADKGKVVMRVTHGLDALASFQS